MKPKLRDYLTVLMAFSAVFLCGYGIGHLVGQREMPAAPAAPIDSGWVRDVLPVLRDTLKLRPEQVDLVERELERTAQEIRTSRDDAVLEYHQHIAGLYDRLIKLLDEKQARQLREQKKSLETRLEFLSTPQP